MSATKIQSGKKQGGSTKAPVAKKAASAKAKTPAATGTTATKATTGTVAAAPKTGPKAAPETAGLTKLGTRTAFAYDAPHASILEAFPNRYPARDYIILFEHPEFTSLCPMTGQPDFGVIRVRYVPDALCVESKSFKLYMGAFRNHGSFMESIVNSIADDLISVLNPRRITVEGVFNVRGGTAISVTADHLQPTLPAKHKEALAKLW